MFEASRDKQDLFIKERAMSKKIKEHRTKIFIGRIGESDNGDSAKPTVEKAADEIADAIKMSKMC